MKAQVLMNYEDRITGEQRQTGDVIEISKERWEEIQKKGNFLAVVLEEEEIEKEETKEKEEKETKVAADSKKKGTKKNEVAADSKKKGTKKNGK